VSGLSGQDRCCGDHAGDHPVVLAVTGVSGGFDHRGSEPDWFWCGLDRPGHVRPGSKHRRTGLTQRPALRDAHPPRAGNPPVGLPERKADPPVVPPPQELIVRVLVLLVSPAVAAWAAWARADTAWAVLHLTGALAGLCALGMAPSYAGAVGAATPEPVDDQGAAYMDQMDQEDWDE